MDRFEKIAKAIIENKLSGVEVRCVDTGHENNIHDFDLLKDNIAFVALEVTSTVASDSKKLKAILRTNKQIEVTKLKKFWHLYITEDFTRLNNIRKQWPKFEDYLLPIERLGIRKFFAPFDASRNLAIRKIFLDLKVEAGFSRTCVKPRILLSHAGSGGKITPDHIQKAVEREAGKQDNRKKLGKTSRNEKHLFIIIDAETDYLGWKAMLEDMLPKEPPNIPQEINTVWLATWTQSGCYLVWRVSPPNNWERLGEIDIGQKA